MPWPRGLLQFTPFGSKDSNVYKLITENELHHSERLSQYREAWKFYKGNHWDWHRDASEPFVTVNYCRAFVDTLVNFLFKKGFKITIPDDPSTPADEQVERDFVRLLLQDTWRKNKQELLSFQMGQTGSVTGDVFLRVSWEENDPLEAAYARVDILPSQYVFPTFGGPYGVDRTKVDSVLALFPKYKLEGASRSNIQARHDRTQHTEVYAERWYADRVEIYDPISDAPPTIKDNPLGEIPIVHIPNYPISGEYFGRGDLADVISLQREFNEKSTDISDVINYHGSPVTIVTGAKLTQLEKGSNRMWGLPEGAKVENLELSGELIAATNYLGSIKTAMHEISGVPEGLLGVMPGNAAGVALSMRYLPLVEKRNVKMQTYGYGLRLVNRLILKLTALMKNDFAKEFNKLPENNKYHNEIVFPDPLPRDEALELDKAKKRLELGLSTRALELEKLGYSQSEIKKIMDDYEAERTRDAEMEFELGMKFAPEYEEPNHGSGNPDPERPNPDVQSEKKSLSVEKDLE